MNPELDFLYRRAADHTCRIEALEQAGKSADKPQVNGMPSVAEMYETYIKYNGTGPPGPQSMKAVRDLILSRVDKGKPMEIDENELAKRFCAMPHWATMQGSMLAREAIAYFREKAGAVTTPIAPAVADSPQDRSEI